MERMALWPILVGVVHLSCEYIVPASVISNQFWQKQRIKRNWKYKFFEGRSSYSIISFNVENKIRSKSENNERFKLSVIHLLVLFRTKKIHSCQFGNPYHLPWPPIALSSLRLQPLPSPSLYRNHQFVSWCVLCVLYCHTAVLLYSCTVILLYCHAAILLYCYTAVLLYCCTVILLYCHAAILLYCHTALLLYCHTAVMSYCYTASRAA